MNTSFEARSVSLSYIRDGDPLPIPETPFDLDNTTKEQVDTFLDELKPRHYAALAEVMDDLLVEIEAVDLADTHSEYSDDKDDPFSNLRKDALSVFFAARGNISGSDTYVQAREYPRIIGRLSPGRHNDLDTQLLAGMDTATSFMVTTLAQFPRIVKALDPNESYLPTDHLAIARRSIGLSWQMAMLCVDQLMAARTVLANELPYSVWSPAQTVINPKHLAAVKKQDKVSLIKFKDIETMEIPEGYAPIPEIRGLEVVTQLKDIECNQERTIGCPITLLPNRLNGLWNWFIDAVEKRNMWDSLT